jgi:hypothetical protein
LLIESRFRVSLSTRSHRSERDPLAILVRVKHPNRDYVADLDKLMGVFDKFRAELADVNKTAAIRA